MSPAEDHLFLSGPGGNSILDVTNPANPTLVKRFNASGKVVIVPGVTADGFEFAALGYGLSFYQAQVIDSFHFLSAEKDFVSLDVIGDNHAPTGISISSQVTREDLVVGGAVGTLSTTDLNGWDSFTYTFAAGAGDENNASFEIVGDEIRSLVAFDFETQSQYSIRVRSTDAAGAWVEKSFTIAVTDVNEAPAEITLVNPITSISEDEDTTNAVHISGISVVDDDLGSNSIAISGPDAASFHYERGFGGAFGGRFAKNGVYLNEGLVLNADTKPFYEVTVSVSDESLVGSSPATVDHKLFVTPVNRIPTLASIDDLVIEEDSGEATVSLSDISSGGRIAQPLRVTATSSNLSLIGNPLVTYASPDSTGSISFSPKLNQFGVATITVAVEDGGLDNNLATPSDNLTIDRIFSVTVTQLNDDPTLDPISDVNINEDDPEQTVNLTGIAAGGGEVQQLQVTATSNNTGLIPDPTVTYSSDAPTGTLAFTPVADQFGTATVTVTVEDGGLDNNLATPGDNATVVRAFTVNVAEVNDDPTLDALSDVNINEDDPEQTVNLTGIAAGGGEAQQLRVTAISNNTGLIPDPTVTYSSSNSTGSLTFTPVVNQNGTATITVTVEDGGLDNDIATPGDNATVVRTFLVNVAEFNDEPTLDELNDINIYEDDPEQTVNLTGITAGSGETQVLAVSAVSDNIGLIPDSIVNFDGQSSTATLKFTPVADQFGTANITVIVEDGGLDNNLETLVDNTTVDRTFAINVASVNDVPVLDATAPNLESVVEDAGAPVGQVGTLVSSLIDTGGTHNNFGDVDGDLPGIAITGTKLQGGSLWSSVDNGLIWQSVNAVTEASPHLLAADATTRLYYQPPADFNGTINDVVAFKAWDRNAGWVQLGADIDGEDGFDYSGYSVSYAADNQTVAIGAPQNNANAGHVRVYSWDGAAWSQLGADIDGEGEGDRSGSSVSLSADGQTVAIGAEANDGNDQDSGHVRVFRWTGAIWSQLGTDIDGRWAYDHFGKSVSLSADGQTVAVGTPYGQYDPNHRGLVSIYQWTGSAWVQLGDNVVGEGVGDEFGKSVSLSGDGQTIAIGAPYNDGSGTDAGHVCVYQWVHSNWQQLGLGIHGDAESDWTGYSVSLSDDGASVAIGASRADGNGSDSGRVRVYSWNGSEWIQRGGDMNGEATDDYSGHSVSLSSDGSTVAVGAYNNRDQGNQSGHVRVYRWTGESWRQLSADIDAEAVGNRFGFSVSLSGEGHEVAIGAYRNSNSSGGDSGHVRVYRFAPHPLSLSESVDQLVVRVLPVNDLPTGSVIITGMSREDEVLTASHMLTDEDGLGVVSWQWNRDSVVIDGATDSTYTMVQADVGAAMTVTANYIDGEGTAESVTSSPTSAVENVSHSPTGSVTTSGTAREDEVLTASHTLSDQDGLGVISWQWNRDGVLIEGATDSAYTLVQADVDAAITVTASYVDGEGTAESMTSAPTSVVSNENDFPMGTVTISGTAREDEVLTASHTLGDQDGLGVISWQWNRDSVVIDGATDSTYTLVQADVGAVMTATASYMDGQGTAESVTSATTAAVVNVSHAPTGSVTIVGTLREDEVLTASHTLADQDGLGVISWQWNRDGVVIDGATDSTYTLVQADVGAVMTATASYTDGEGTAESVTSSPTSAVVNVSHSPTGSVTITGTATEDEFLTASNTLADQDGLGVISWQWNRDGVLIDGATNSTYTLVQADVGALMTVTASYTDGEGTAESVTSSPTSAVVNVNDSPTGGVTVRGVTRENEVLSADTSILADEDGLGPLDYQWFRSGSAIDGATSSSYTLTQTDVGAVVRVVVSYTDAYSNAESVDDIASVAVTNVNDSPAGSVTITGTSREDEVLTASHALTDEDGLGVMSWQWNRDGMVIDEATDSTYTLVQADVDAAMTVTANYIDGEGTAESVTSSPTSAVENVSHSPTGSVTTSGTAREDEVLTASHTLSDQDGLGVISWQWNRDGVLIEGATDSAYTLVQADVDAAITVTASYVDGEGTAESMTSAPTSVVSNENDFPMGTVTISGTAREDEVLTASHTLGDQDGLGVISWQWNRDSVVIDGATDSTYTLVQADVGAVMTATASYMDGQGTAESVTSATTAAVVNVSHAPTGSVTIVGTLREDEVLTASHMLTDQDGLGVISWQWNRDGVVIDGATDSTYTLVQADVGAVMTATASYTDGEGTAENVTSESTSAVVNVSHSPTGSVTISGTAREDQVLTASHTLSDQDGLGVISWQWNRDGVLIDGATNSAYTLVQADVDAAITVTASYVDGEGTAESVTSAPTAVVENVNDEPLGAVTIIGIALEGQFFMSTHTLTDEDGLGTVSWQWSANGTVLPGAISDEYWLSQDDVGDVFTVTASYVDGEGTAESVTSAPTSVVSNENDFPVGTVTITGTAREDEVLTASHTLGDQDGLGTVSWQWNRDGVAIAGATGSTYTLVQADVGAVMTVTASYIDGQSTAESVTSSPTSAVVNVSHSPTGSVTISGVAREDEVLSASHALSDADNLGVISWQWNRDGVLIVISRQWNRDGVAIDGATDSTYTLVQADVGASMTVTASYTDGESTAESVTSAPTAVVENKSHAPTGSVTISGTAREDEVLTASHTLFDGDGLGVMNWQWSRDGVLIHGANGSTYTLVQADVGAAMTVTASYVDGEGASESVTSSATALVLNQNDAPVGEVLVSQFIKELVASSTLTDEDGLGEISWQWNREGVAIGGATGSTYTLTQDDADVVITVTARYTDGEGAEERVVSSGVSGFTVISEHDTVVLMKDASEKLYVNTQPVSYNGSHAHEYIEAFKAIGARSNGTRKELILEKSMPGNLRGITVQARDGSVMANQWHV